jgi:hypothetical protein
LELCGEVTAGGDAPQLPLGVGRCILLQNSRGFCGLVTNKMFGEMYSQRKVVSMCARTKVISCINKFDVTFSSSFFIT